MVRVVLTFGLISGVIISVLMWLMLAAMKAGAINFDNGEIWGYSTMIIALSLVFFGIKSYRDNNGGKVTFFKGLQVGILIGLISACCYSLSWEAYVRTSGGDFMQEYTTHYLEKMKEKGEPPEKVESARAEMEKIAELYKNPAIRFGMTLMEILPVAVIVSIISAALLRKREVLPAQPA